MSSKIRVLSDQTINKIAAGEVIENPASVVKELVENSLDAGATTICVEIQEGGRQLIRISDNGYGMSRDDALLCLERHATSKIREVEDIQELLTMGFRGEALPSVAAISKFNLLTCPRIEENTKSEEGTFIFVEGGHLLSCSTAARAPGTTIEVKSLFFNVPVRRKFQKSPTLDTQEILRVLGLLALAYPTVQFELINDEKLLLKTPYYPQIISFQDLLGKRLENVLGQEYAASLLPLKFQQAPYELEGFIGVAAAHKLNRNGQHLFINQRLVFSPLIASAVREGYGTMLPNHRYPIFVLHLRLPGSLLDVNVHPQKREIRLRQEHILKEAIIQAVQMALRQEQGKLTESTSLLSLEEKNFTPPFWGAYASLLSPNQIPKATEEAWEFKPVPTLTSPIVDSNPISSSPQPFLSSNSFTQNFSTPAINPILTNIRPTLSVPRILTTLVGYCVLDPFQLDCKLFGIAAGKKEGGLALLDQRAAYTRIYYEQLLKRSSTKETQTLLIPLTLQFTPTECNVIKEHLPLLNKMGFGLREFGDLTFVIDSFPLFLKQDQLQSCLNALIQDLIEAQSTRRLQSKQEEQIALSACRVSLPTAKRLSIEEAQGLLQQLILCDLPAQCPMGKNTCLYLAPDEINKWFQKAGV